jgi:hypothetical protein
MPEKMPCTACETGDESKWMHTCSKAPVLTTRLEYPMSEKTWWAVRDGQGRSACFCIEDGRPQTANALFSPELEALLYSACMIECEVDHDGRFLMLRPKLKEKR